MNQIEQYVEMIGSFSVDTKFRPAFDLLMGVHPETLHLLSNEDDRVLHLLKYIDADQLLEAMPTYGREHIAYLWYKYFPDIKNIIRLNKDKPLYEVLWSHAYKYFTVRELGYIFYQGCSINDYDDHFKQVSEQSKIASREIERRSARNKNDSGGTTWTFQFPINSAIGRIVDSKNGLNGLIKKGVGLFHLAPKLLCRYILNVNPSLLNLSPYQFEDLIATLFLAEGWKVFQTPKTRDGGKDLVVQKGVGRDAIIAYVQAKRYSKTKIGIPLVKEFAATMIGDQVYKGFFITSSQFTRPAAIWLNGKIAGVVSIELIDKENLLEKMGDISQIGPSFYLLDYLVELQ